MVDSNTIIDIFHYENGANNQEQNGYKLIYNLGNTVAYELGSVTNELLNTNEILIYPNPSNNLANINSQDLISKITITNSVREVVFENTQIKAF